MDGEDADVGVTLGKEYARVGRAGTKAEVSESAGKCLIPFSSGLLESVQRLVKSFDAMLPLSLIAGGFLHIYLLVVVECAVKVGTVEVERLYVPVVSRGHS